MLNFCNRFNSPTFDSSKRSKLKSEDDVHYLFSQAKTRSTLLYVVSCGPTSSVDCWPKLSSPFLYPSLWAQSVCEHLYKFP